MPRQLTIVAVLVLASICAQPAQATPPGSSAAVPASPVTAPQPAAVPPLEPQGYTYNPHGRRDPFVSLTRRGADSQRTVTGARAAGLAGLGVDEITLKGTLASAGGFVGIVRGADNKTYIVHAGEKLLDGTIRAIAADAMVVMQQVNDPLTRQKERAVRKALRETEEAK